MIRWLVYLLAAPLVFLIGLGQGFQTNPAPPMPTGEFQTGEFDVAAATPIARAPGVPTPMAGEAASEPERLATLVAAAKQWLGTPYLWGGCTPRGVDCSCFVQHAYAVLGVSVPRTTVTQVAAFTPIPREQMRVGDSIFYDDTCRNCGPNPTHVGMYLGNGLQIDAGDPVQIEPVFWSKFHSAGRPIGL